MSTAEVFRRITSALDVAEIPYMLTGSFAGAHYGSPRSTQDIDIVIEASPLRVGLLIDSLTKEGEYYAELEAALEAQRSESLFNVIDSRTGWKIDFIFRKSRSFSHEEFARRQRTLFLGVPIFVATAEDIIISKLEWAKLGNSQRQLEDVAAILRLRSDKIEIPYLEKWISQLALNEEWVSARRMAGEPGMSNESSPLS